MNYIILFIIGLGVAYLLCFIMALAITSSPKTPEEQAREDEAQMQALSRYRDHSRPRRRPHGRLAVRRAKNRKEKQTTEEAR